MFESDADRLAMIQAVGEQFDTGKPTKLWAIFDSAFLAEVLQRQTVSGDQPMFLCRTSDVQAHELIKKSPVTRVSDGEQFIVKDLEPDGTGMTLVHLQ